MAALLLVVGRVALVAAAATWKSKLPPLLVAQPFLLPDRSPLLQAIRHPIGEFGRGGPAIRKLSRAADDVEAAEVGLLRVALHRQLGLDQPSSKVLTAGHGADVNLVERMPRKVPGGYGLRWSSC